MNRVSAQIVSGLEPGEKVVIGQRTAAPAAPARPRQARQPLVPKARERRRMSRP